MKVRSLGCGIDCEREVQEKRKSIEDSDSRRDFKCNEESLHLDSAVETKKEDKCRSAKEVILCNEFRCEYHRRVRENVCLRRHRERKRHLKAVFISKFSTKSVT